MIQEHDGIVLTENLPAETLEAGDVGTVIHIHPGGAAYEVELMTLTGQTIAVTTVLPTQPRQARILKLRYGIGQAECTLQEIAEMLDLTRERIRQIQQKAEQKLRRRLQKDPYFGDFVLEACSDASPAVAMEHAS